MHHYLVDASKQNMVKSTTLDQFYSKTSTVLSKNKILTS